MSTNYGNITEEPGLAESQQPTSGKSHPRLRRYLCCLGWLILLLGGISLIVTLVLLSSKLKHPRMTIDSLSIAPSKLMLKLNSTDDLIVEAHFSIRNRDQATFWFDSIRTYLLYRGLYVGTANLPAGQVYAGSTFSNSMAVNATMADGILSHPGWAGDLEAGSIALELSTQTLGGRIQGSYRRGRWYSTRHVDAMVECNVTVSVPNLTVLSRECD